MRVRPSYHPTLSHSYPSRSAGVITSEETYTSLTSWATHTGRKDSIKTRRVKSLTMRESVVTPWSENYSKVAQLWAPLAKQCCSSYRMM